MRDFTLMQGLLAAGGVVLALVFAHGLWQGRRARPRQAEPAAGGRQEPQLDGLPAGLAEVAALDEGLGAGGALPVAAAGGAGAWEAAPGGAAAGLPAQDSAAARAGPGAALAAVPRKTARLDPLIDAIALLQLEQPVSGEMALTHLPASRRAGTKPFLIEGCNAASGEWELPAAGQRYSAFQAGVQLANRTGALNEIEYSEFVQKLQGFADGVGAMLELPDMLDVVARARELDQFANDHDAQLAVTLRATEAAWTSGFIQQCAARHGFIPGVIPGRLVLPSAEEGAPPILTLNFDAQAAMAEDPNARPLRAVQLMLDVPQSPESAEPFPAWHSAARLLAKDLDALVMDDQGRAVTLQAYDGIAQDLKILYGKLAERDLAAGSAAARRLFS